MTTMVKEFSLEEEIEKCYRSDAPKTHNELMIKITYNNSVIDTNLFELFINEIDLSVFKNIQHIYILTEEEIQNHLELQNIGVQPMNGVAVHNLETGKVIVNLTQHLLDKKNWLYNTNEVFVSLLHEVRHAWQTTKESPLYPYMLNHYKKLLGLEYDKEINPNIIEEDADNFGYQEVLKIYSRLEGCYQNMINWNKI